MKKIGKFAKVTCHEVVVTARYLGTLCAGHPIRMFKIDVNGIEFMITEEPGAIEYLNRISRMKKFKNKKYLSWWKKDLHKLLKGYRIVDETNNTKG